MNIIDLRQTTVRQIEPLLEEEARHWCDELHWDYRGALELIKRFMEARALAGCAAFENGAAAGYSFYVLEEQKGLIGGLYVSCKFAQEALGRRLLEEMLYSMRAIPHLMRIEAQLMPFSGPVDAPLLDHGFRLYTRQFMLLDLHRMAESKAGASGGLRLARWNDRYFEPCAKLIYLAYANHVDGEINDQYRSRAGALKFLKNIILLPGCGQFVPGGLFCPSRTRKRRTRRRRPNQRSFFRGRTHDANLCLARISRTRHRPHAHANFRGGVAFDEIPGVNPHRHFRQPHRRAALREARLPDHQVFHRRRLAPITEFRDAGGLDRPDFLENPPEVAAENGLDMGVAVLPPD